MSNFQLFLCHSYIFYARIICIIFHGFDGIIEWQDFYLNVELS